MRRIATLVALVTLTALVVATAATAGRPNRGPGVRQAQVDLCPPSSKPSDSSGNSGQGSGNSGQGNGNSGQGNGNATTQGGPQPGTGGAENANGNAGGNGNSNAGGNGNSNAGGNGNSNAGGNGNGQGQGTGNSQGDGNSADTCVTPPADPAGVAGDGRLPLAKAGETVNVEPTDGQIRVKQPGTDGFAALEDSAQLPEGTVIDAREGTIELTSAGTGENGQQTAAFTGAKFAVRQEESAAAVTELVLRGGEFKGCPRLDHGRRAQAIRNGFIAARGGNRRSLFGSGHGRFRTRGRWGSATVRGTVWKVEDRCEGTLTTVVRGVVQVSDFGLNRTVAVKAGEEYFAKVR